MCTAINLKTASHYFGRTLDLDVSYGEKICIVPRNYEFNFTAQGKTANHAALIGMAAVMDGTPLFYDAANEYGLCMAGLNFPGNACYLPEKEGKINVASFELIPYILTSCKNVDEAKKLFKNINISDKCFAANVPTSPLHWIVSDEEKSIVIEPMTDGVKIFDNPTGVMTNNPTFDYHLMNLNNYRNLSPLNGENLFAKDLEMNNFCAGLGAVGLPGDVSSPSRFVRAVFHVKNSVCSNDENESVHQFFHIMNDVSMTKGCCKTLHGTDDYTVYTGCINASKGIYYYTTYNNSTINTVCMHKENLDSAEVKIFDLKTNSDIRIIN